MTRKRVAIVLTNEAFIPRKSEYRPPTSTRSPARNPVPNRPDVSIADEQLWQDLTANNPRFTGVDIFEVGYFWLILHEQLNIDLDFFSPNGGAVAVDPLSVEMVHKDEKLKGTIRKDPEFITKLSHSVPLEYAEMENYVGILIPGKHGVMFDLATNEKLEKMIAEVYEKDGWVGTIGHGSAAILDVKLSNGDYLVRNRRMACFSNREEKERKYDQVLPFLLEDRLRERGAKLENKEPSQPNVVIDGRLITGQNELSIKEFMNKIAEKLGHRGTTLLA